MKRRIRIHQVRIGMFIDELEGALHPRFSPDERRVVSSQTDIDRLMLSNAHSALIDTTKGRDLEAGFPPSRQAGPPADKALQLPAIPREYLHLARRMVEDVRPHVHSVLMKARLHGALDIQATDSTVDRIVSETMVNAGALIELVKLKHKDEGTFLHSISVSALMITFGRSLSLGSEQVRQLGFAGLVHDLGKSALPVELLQKPGKLNQEDLAVIQTHPEKGYDLLRNVPDCPQAVLDVCLFHHEKFDGSGYPRRLSAHQIPVSARIATICDVYDALTTIRPYKPAWSQAEAIETMLRASGHFDPNLLRAFVSKLVISGAIR